MLSLIQTPVVRFDNKPNSSYTVIFWTYVRPLNKFGPLGNTSFRFILFVLVVSR